MPDKIYRYFASRLEVDPIVIEKMDIMMSDRVGRKDVLAKLYEKSELAIERMLRKLPQGSRNPEAIINHMRSIVTEDENEVKNLIDKMEGGDIFEKSVVLARRISSAKKGFFLKKEVAEKILRKRPPEELLKHFNLSSVDELMNKFDLMEIFSALRFVETDEWMHQTFDVAYSEFTADDFEEREIEIKVLGKEWQEMAEKFVAKKHHNVSHLKEFGVIFLNPIAEDLPGKLLRDFALLFHYFHEIAFYSKLFQRYADRPDFASHLKALLRGDVIDFRPLQPGEWMIIQRYLWKVNPQDERLFVPHMNPESLHWHRGERDLAKYKSKIDHGFDLQIWNDEDWVGLPLGGKLLSFDLEDNVMSFVSFNEGKKDEYFNYHLKEALWTKIFSEYVGGEKKMEELLIENFDQGIIQI